MANEETRFLIRYDGLDAAEHKIELSDLSESLHGISRLVTVNANFAETLKYVKHTPSLNVRVYAGVPEEKCFQLWIYLQHVAQQPLFEGSGGLLLVESLHYCIDKWSAKAKEMEAMKDALLEAIRQLGHRNEADTSRFLDTIERMSNDLRGSVRQAVQPIGRTAETITFGWNDRKTVVDAQKRQAIIGDMEIELLPPKVFTIYISEADIESRHCKVSFDAEHGQRFKGVIQDPAFQGKSDPYTLAMHKRESLRVLAKSEINTDGDLVKLHILTLV